MKVPIKVDRDFEKTMVALGEKYGEDFEFLNGFHESQLNFSDFIDGFIDKKVADVTIDANANASNKDIRSLLNEKGKSHDKLFAFSKIFYELKKRYNLTTAKNWLETEYNGGFYLHDASSSTYLPYCYAYDLTRLATEGLFFLSNYNNQPPKHLTTFLDDVIEYISYMSNRSSGAVGIPNILIWTYYFWKKDCESGHFIKDPELSLLQNRHPEWEIDSLPPDGVLFWVKVGAAMLIPYLGLVISLVLMFFGEKLCVVAVMRIENRIELELIAEQYRNANGKILKEEEGGF